MSGRRLKARILELLQGDDFAKNLEEISRLPARQTVNALLSFFYHADEHVRWHAVTAVGREVAVLAAEELEAARVVVRRLMWHLNDESGGIGWGAPEAMGEIMACQAQLACEFSHILVSYIRPEANYIEYEPLQRGVLWGIGRLARSRPRLIGEVPPLLSPYLESPDPTIRGLAAWTAGFLDARAIRRQLVRLTADTETIRIYLEGAFLERRIGLLAGTALSGC